MIQSIDEGEVLEMETKASRVFGCSVVAWSVVILAWGKKSRDFIEYCSTIVLKQDKGRLHCQFGCTHVKM